MAIISIKNNGILNEFTVKVDNVNTPAESQSALDTLKVSLLPQVPEFANGQEYFRKAIAAGFLSHNADAGNFYGHYMFMGVLKNEAHFKHINLRAHIKISLVLLNEL